MQGNVRRFAKLTRTALVFVGRALGAKDCVDSKLYDASHPLPLGVADYSTEHSADTAGVLAFTSLAMIPALVLFLALQRRIVGGLQGAVKG